MRSFLSLLVSLFLLAFFGGAAWFFWDTAKNLEFSEKGMPAAAGSTGLQPVGESR